MSRARINRPKTRFAHFPGGGPAGKSCGDCDHRRPDRKKELICHKAAELAGLRPEDCQPVAGSTRACKYFIPTTPRCGDLR
ncbi:MAG: hypothetical protein LDL44_03205 [Caenispirillum sp.]|nr:hypothetical protein [Caenispirillum sp.]